MIKDKKPKNKLLLPPTQSLLIQFLNIIHPCKFIFFPKRFAWRWKLFILAKKKNFKRIKADPTFAWWELCFHPPFSLFFFPCFMSHFLKLRLTWDSLQTTLKAYQETPWRKLFCKLPTWHGFSDLKAEAWKPIYPNHFKHKFCSSYRWRKLR